MSDDIETERKSRCYFCHKDFLKSSINSHERMCPMNPNNLRNRKKAANSAPLGFYCQYCGEKTDNRIAHERECGENPVNIIKSKSSFQHEQECEGGNLNPEQKDERSVSEKAERALNAQSPMSPGNTPRNDDILSSDNVLEVAKTSLMPEKKRDCSAILYILAILLIINIMLNALTLLGA